MDTTVFSVRVEDLNRGVGPQDHLLAQNCLNEEVLELMEEREVQKGQGQDHGPGEGQ